jgi:hypothetical protein
MKLGWVPKSIDLDQRYPSVRYRPSPRQRVRVKVGEEQPLERPLERLGELLLCIIERRLQHSAAFTVQV